MTFPVNELVLSNVHPVGVIGWRQDVATLIPHAREATLEGVRVLIVPHMDDETKLLRNLGVAAPWPILHRYDWAGNTPFAVQKITAAMLASERAAYVLSEMGTGKTLSVLFAFDYLLRAGRASNMLVVAPLSTLRTTWETEIRNRMPHLHSLIVHGDAEFRDIALSTPAHIYLINHDGVKFTDKLFSLKFDIVCIDEMTPFKTANTKRSKAMFRVISGAKWRWGMTGTPTARSPEDAYGQCRLITPDTVPSSFTRWRDKVMIRNGLFEWRPREGATAIVHNAMQPAVRFARSDVMELPPLQIIRREAPMSSKQERVYRQVLRDLRAEVDAGTVTVANAAVQLTKLLQISSGFVYTTDGAAADLDPKPRLDVIGEVVQEAQSKFLVFAPFKAGVDLIAKRLEADGWQVGVVTGDVSASHRVNIFEAFTDEHGPLQGIVAHPGTMSHGLNLQVADMVVWSAPVASLETYEQANARITRPGQTRKQMIVQIIGSPVEAKVYRRLDNRAAMQRLLLDLFDKSTGDYLDDGY